MASISNEQPMQAFRNPSTDEVVNIPTHKDPDTSNLVVLWQDIQDMFDNIEYIKDGKSLVSFLTDDNLVQITPLRIAYYPGAVLELVVGSNSRAADGGAMAPTKAISQDHNNRSVVVHSGKISDDTSVIVHNYIQALLLGQQRHAANIKQSIDERFDQLLAVMDKDRERQELLIWMQQQTGDKQLQIQNLQQQTKEELLEKLVQLYQLHQQAEARLLQSQQEIMDIQHQSREEILKKNDEIVQLQVQALDRMVAMYNRIQAIVTQTSELHEHPIPRLFIILPKFKLPEIKTTHSHPGGFRLYFLCECGIHTTSEDKMSAPVIHMAKHGGYDLENPEEFFEKYGSYSLTLMQMIKYGPVVSNLAVPSLTQLLDGLEASQENLEYIKNNIPALVDDSINFLQGFKVNSESEVATIHEELDMSEAFSKADLRQLESYLKIEDRGDVLGRLSRIVTPEGHIKWVCLDHRHSNYQEANIQRLKEVVDNSQGTFLEQEGKVTIAVMSSVMAKEFNDAVIRAHRVQELDISLGWDATREDLRAFANAVTKTKVVSLTIHGSHFKRGPRLDDLNPACRQGLRIRFPKVQIHQTIRHKSLS
ncbi:hypothetical protein B0O80DRAFT_209576 [Mortierella sp. GBAus27b]|nr:hypothetical protein B0O80DRAFT_209576 [Mortierella sp. GBAus27b]